MKKLFLLIVCILNMVKLSAQDEFITTWQTTSDGESITIPTTGTGYNYEVDWGDGTVETGFTGNATHTYTTAGTYTVEITGDFPASILAVAGPKSSFMTVEQWGNNQWTNMRGAFKGCSNLEINATDAPDLSNCTNMREMFSNCTSLNQDISHWNVSNITNMFSLFQDAEAFNQSLDNWNVSNVANMGNMFQRAEAFNQDLNSWNTASATNMSSMFNDADAFNGNISAWNVKQSTACMICFTAIIRMLSIKIFLAGIRPMLPTCTAHSVMQLISMPTYLAGMWAK